MGHIISENNVMMDPEKIEVVKNWKTPSKVVHIQQFIGLCGYYRKFIENFAKIEAPLYTLLKKDIKWNWSIDCDEAFNSLKQKLILYPVLRQPNFNLPFAIHTDASGWAIGAILTQTDNKNQEYIIAYASRLLKGAEIHYGITEKECLAVIWAINKI